MTQSAPQASGKAAEFDLGVLFVHGIGEQQQYSTLARFGGAVQRWLRQWEEGRRAEAQYGRVAPPPVVDVVQRGPASRWRRCRKQPAHAEVAVGSDKKWLLAEAWWAPEVTPPRFKEFIRWVLPMFPWLAAEYAVAAGHRVYRPDPSPSLNDRQPSWVERGSLAGLVWLASPLIAVVLMVVCLLLALLQRLPVIGKRVSSLTVSLVKGVGDSYLFAHDAFARTAMVQRIRKDLDWLRAKGCDQVVIVAHSQGAALCHDMLRDDDGPKDIDLLVTVGSGVQRLNGFRELYRNATLRSIGWWSIGAMAALAAGTVLVVGALGPGIPGLWAWSGFALVVAGALVPGIYNSWVAVSRPRPKPEDEAARVLPGVRWGTVSAVLGAVALGMAGLLAQGQVDVRLMAGSALLVLGIVGYALAYRKVETQIENPPQLALPPGAVVDWVDYYSTADPVPNGPLVTWTTAKRPKQDSKAVHPLPRMVYNLRSVQADHSFYFDNADEFVSQLALDLAGRGGVDLGPLKARDRPAPGNEPRGAGGPHAAATSATSSSGRGCSVRWLSAWVWAAAVGGAAWALTWECGPSRRTGRSGSCRVPCWTGWPSSPSLGASRTSTCRCSPACWWPPWPSPPARWRSAGCGRSGTATPSPGSSSGTGPGKILLKWGGDRVAVGADSGVLRAGRVAGCRDGRGRPALRGRLVAVAAPFWCLGRSPLSSPSCATGPASARPRGSGPPPRPATRTRPTEQSWLGRKARAQPTVSLHQPSLAEGKARGLTRVSR